jgi:hypothetical protein
VPESVVETVPTATRPDFEDVPFGANSGWPLDANLYPPLLFWNLTISFPHFRCILWEIVITSFVFLNLNKMSFAPFILLSLHHV